MFGGQTRFSDRREICDEAERLPSVVVDIRIRIHADKTWHTI